jgi:hypothetical protein
MVERIFIIDAHEPRLDAAAARRQFSLSVAVGFAVLATAAIIQFQSATSAPAPLAAPAERMQAPVSQFAAATSEIDRD